MQARKPTPRTQPHCIRGVTLIEVVIVVAIIGIVTAAAMPSMRSTLSNSHSTTVGNRLLADLSLARSEAIMSRMPAVVCPSSDRSTCSDSDDWSSGWIVFIDSDGNDQRSASEPVLSAASGSDLGGLQVKSTVDRTKARFLPDGRSGGTNLSVRVCDGAKLTRSVVVNISGRSRLEMPATAQTACD